MTDTENKSEVHSFFSTLSGSLNRGKSRSVMLYGNVNDLFYNGKEFVPLVDFLSTKCELKSENGKKGLTQIIYEMDRDIRFVGDEGELRTAWDALMRMSGTPKWFSFDEMVTKSKIDHVSAVEFLRSLTVCSQKMRFKNNLMIIIDGVESLIPFGNFAQLSIPDRTKISIFCDWFRDPKFMNGNDSVVLIGESRGMIHDSIARLPQLLSIEVPASSDVERRLFVELRKAEVFPNFVEMTAGLSIQAVRQLCCDKASPQAVVEKIEAYISNELGDAVEFIRPTKNLDSVVGYGHLKKFFKEELVPRFLSTGDDALNSALVVGPIGVGKTFIIECLCAEPEMSIPILILKNLRSQFFGQTDVIFEKLRRLLIGIGKVCIIVDEADTMFGGVGGDVHETERRLTGKIQAMMSATELRGKVIWILMTARPHMLSPDMRRPGRGGDMIIPILDPTVGDAREFRAWVFKDIVPPDGVDVSSNFDLQEATSGYSAAAYQALRSRLKAKKAKTILQAFEIAKDMVMPDIGDTRAYQTAQAVLNCTSRSLLPQDPQFSGNYIEKFRKIVADLEAKGIH
jgi:hypothetical protein